MPKHRSTCYTVVREKSFTIDNGFGESVFWEFDGLVGTYVTAARADEIASGTIQHYIDAGMDECSPEYRCTVKPSTWYDE
jgi:hypothetical protein